MSVEPSELSTEAWTRWQGHVINGVFPLGRYLGCSDHSGVFLTKSVERGFAEVAIKLVPADRALAELQLPRWKRAGSLAHPHLLRMLEWGGCQLEGLPYLYTVMEYADQTLAQLLLHRPLTEDEAREMLMPSLDALAFLHGRNLVQGSLKAANILVVGDQLKLASDTVRRASEGPMSSHATSGSPEDRRENSATAADIRALGMTLFEALTRRQVSGSGEPRQAVVLPADFSPAFRDVVTRCLSPHLQDRPSVMELLAWAGRPSPEPAPANPRPAGLVVSEPSKPDSAAPRPVPPQVAPTTVVGPLPARAQLQKPRALRTTLLWVIVIFVLLWTGWRLISSHRTPAPPSPALQSPAGLTSQAPAAGSPTTMFVGRRRRQRPPRSRLAGTPPCCPRHSMRWMLMFRPALVTASEDT